LKSLLKFNLGSRISLGGKWNGSGMEVEWKWNGSGMEVESALSTSQILQ